VVINKGQKINIKSFAEEIGEMTREDFIKAYSSENKRNARDAKSNKFNGVYTIEESLEICKYRDEHGHYPATE